MGDTNYGVKPKVKTEWDKARKEIAEIIKAEAENGYLEHWGKTEELLTPEQQQDYFLVVANLILSLVEIKAKDQSLPQYPTLNSHDEGFAILAQQDMLTPQDGYVWMRVEKKGE